MKKSESINELAAALAKAQGEIRGAFKDSENPFFRSRYADLASVWEACRGPLAKNGLSVVQTVDENEKGTVLETMLAHSSGQWVSSAFPLMPVDKKPQSMGSAITYARRYSLQAMVGIAPEDDDGNAASGVTIPQLKVDQPGPDDGISNPIAPRPPSRSNGAGHKKSEHRNPTEDDKQRSELTARLAKVYRPFLTEFPETQMTYLLKNRYGVGDSKELALDQLKDLIIYMEGQLEKSA